MNNSVPESEYDRKLIRSERKPLPLLPELEMLEAIITEVKFEFAMFQGKQQYVTDYETKEIIYDANGQPIPRKEFNITFEIAGHSLSNGKPRKAWLKVGSSLGDKSKLSKLLNMLMIKLVDPTPKDIIAALLNRELKFQLVNKSGKDGNVYQNVNFDSIRCLVRKPLEAPIVQTISVEDIKWEE